MRKRFSGWLEGLKFYGPFFLVGAALSGYLWSYGYGWVGYPFLVVGFLVMLFFRDFPRTVTAGEREVVSPADGKVVAIEELANTPYFRGPCRRISIFLSVFNVHVNRTPYAGVIRSVVYKPGEFRPAMRAETTDCNESNMVVLDTPDGTMTIRQISGIIARRIVCRAVPGAPIEKGQRFGMIRFGSRTELYLPATAEIVVKVGEKVRGAATVVARL